MEYVGIMGEPYDDKKQKKEELKEISVSELIEKLLQDKKEKDKLKLIDAGA